MSEYTFSIPCTGTETYTVEADSAESALDMVARGDVPVDTMETDWDATPSLDHLQGGEA